MKILIADDSAVIRIILEQELSKDPEIQIAASLNNGPKALDYVREHEVDLAIINDSEDGANSLEKALTFTRDYLVPTIVLGSRSTPPPGYKESDVVFMRKPDLRTSNPAFYDDLRKTVRRTAQKPLLGNGKNAYTRKHAARKPDSAQKKYPVALFGLHKPSDSPVVSLSPYRYKVLCIGASTGGPTAAQEVIVSLGNNFPLPIIYVQHIATNADTAMAQWFETSCPNVSFHLAESGVQALPGHVYMAPAEKHLVITLIGPNGLPVIRLNNDPPVRFLRPAVDKLFESAAKHYRGGCLAVLLTGMGSDGARGCRQIVDAGGYTIVEDESTCAVFGMPQAAIAAGGACAVLPRPQIGPKILSAIRGEE